MKKLLLSLLITLIIPLNPAAAQENGGTGENPNKNAKVSIQSYSENSDLIDDYIDMARIYTTNAEYDKALEYIEIINKISPNNPKILYEKAIILKNYNQPILARNLMLEVARLDPNYKDTYLYKEFFKDDIPGFYMPKDYDTEYYKNKGNEAFDEEKYEKALEYYRKAVNLKRSSENYNNLGKAYVKINNKERALKCFEEAINLDIKEPTSYINMAAYYAEFDKDSKKQQNYLKHAIKLNPDLAEPYYLLGNIYNEKGMYETAAEYYRMATAKNDLFFDAYLALGETLYKLQDFEETYLVLKKSLTIELDNLKVYEYLTKAAIELRQFGEAQSFAEQAISLQPTQDNYLSLAKILYFKGDFDGSIKLLNTKIADPKNPEMYNYLGLNYFQKNMLDEALKNFSKAVEIKEKPNYLYNIAVCYNVMGDKNNMLYYANRAINTSAGSPEDFLDIAKFYLDQNNTQGAISTLTKGISVYPKERKLYKEKMELLKKTGATKEYNSMNIQYNSAFPKETVYLGK